MSRVLISIKFVFLDGGAEKKQKTTITKGRVQKVKSLNNIFHKRFLTFYPGAQRNLVFVVALFFRGSPFKD